MEIDYHHLYSQLHLLNPIQRAGKHDGWEETAWLGLEMSVEELAKRKVKVVINGGCLNPQGLAAKVANLVSAISNACFRRFNANHINRCLNEIFL